MDNVWRLSAAVIASAGLFCMTLPSMAQNNDTVELLPQPTQKIQLRPGLSQQIRLKRAYSRVEISNPPVVDVQPNTDREATIVAVLAGSTVVKFRDEKGALVGQFIASVWPPPSRTALSTFEDVPGRVKVYRTPDRTGFYRCSDSGCELVAEQQLSVPPPQRAQKPASVTDEETQTDKSQTETNKAQPAGPPKP